MNLGQRNKPLAFHHHRQEMETVYNDLPSEFEFITYLGAYIGHTLYAGSEILSINAMITLVKGSTPLEAIDKVHKDTIDVSQWLVLFVTGFMNVMIRRHLSPMKREQIETLTIEAEPSISECSLPFFSSLPQDVSRNNE